MVPKRPIKYLAKSAIFNKKMNNKMSVISFREYFEGKNYK